jgi:DNA-binding response OmpR family regulator
LDESNGAAQHVRTDVTLSTTILVVEDEPALLRLTARTLEREGFTVIAAPGPAAALDLLAQHHGTVELLLTDVIMPGMSGPQLAVLVREERPDIRILFMSGYPADVVTARATLPSSTEYLQKPFTAEELLQRVTAVLHSGG